MFDGLSDKLSAILSGLTRRGALTEEDVNAALREVRRALLEADVALEVVRSFVDKVRARAVGAEVIKSVSPGQQVVKIVHDQLVEMLGAEAETIDLDAPAPVAILMVGLQGSGKTTTTAKIARRLAERQKRRVLMASLDTRRPAAMEQLAVLGKQVGVETLPIVAGQSAVQIARRALEAARLGGYDVVMLDTAGRVTVDEALMAEAAEVKAAANPHEVLLVADALTGQDAVNTARAFDGRLGVTGIVLTRMDGDARGGAALSMRAVTGKPIKLVGTGEKVDALDEFHPARVANRILGMGDIVSLVEKAAETIDQHKALRIAEKMRKGALRPRRPARPARPDGEDRRHRRHARHAARHRQDEDADREREPRRAGHQAPAGDHRFDDAGRAPQPGRPQGLAQAPHRGRLGRQGRGRQPPPQDAPPDGRHDEGHGLGQARRHRRGPRQHVRDRRRHAPADARSRSRPCRSRWAGSCPPFPGGPGGGLPPMPPGLGKGPALPGLGGGKLPGLPGLGLPLGGKKK